MVSEVTERLNQVSKPFYCLPQRLERFPAATVIVLIR
jgi:hypothetical protein